MLFSLIGWEFPDHPAMNLHLMSASIRLWSHFFMIHKPNVRPFFGPKVSHFLKVRTTELLTTINTMKCAKYDHSHLHFWLVFC